MLVELERTPPSAERDWMLGEVRARAVDVDAGVEPAAMRAKPGIATGPKTLPPSERSGIEREKTVPKPKPRRRRAARRPAVRSASHTELPTSVSKPSPSRTLERAADRSATDLLEGGGVLCLDDEPPVADGTSHPWARGLRG